MLVHARNTCKPMTLHPCSSAVYQTSQCWHSVLTMYSKCMNNLGWIVNKLCKCARVRSIFISSQFTQASLECKASELPQTQQAEMLFGSAALYDIPSNLTWANILALSLMIGCAESNVLTKQEIRQTVHSWCCELPKSDSITRLKSLSAVLAHIGQVPCPIKPAVYP